jgi:hypothetical protein
MAGSNVESRAKVTVTTGICKGISVDEGRRQYLRWMRVGGSIFGG